MHETIGLAVVGIAVLGSISVAVVVEWFALWGLMKMMPGPEAAVAPVAAAGAAMKVAGVNAAAASAAGDGPKSEVAASADAGAGEGEVVAAPVFAVAAASDLGLANSSALRRKLLELSESANDLTLVH